MNNYFDNGQCVISYRLLKLLQWLVAHEQESLKSLIHSCVRSGLSFETEKIVKQSESLEEELRQNVVDYFSLLEILITEVTSEDDLRHSLQRQLIPALDRIDNSLCDVETVALSVEKVSLKNGLESKEVAKEVMFKELLKRWKPVKKALVN